MAIILVVLVGFLTSSLVNAAEMSIFAPEEPPLGYTNADGAFTGVSVDVVKAIQKRVGNTDEIQVVPWSRAYYYGLQKPNVVLFTAARSAEREDKFHWITPINQNAWAFFANKESSLEINSLEDVKTVESIGVMRGAAHERYLLNHGFSANITHGVTSFQQNVKKLRTGRIDLLFYSVIGLAISSRQVGIDFDDFRPLLIVTPPKAYIVMSKGTDLGIVKKWQEAAAAIKADGTFTDIAKAWSQRIELDFGLRSHVKDGVLKLWEEK